MHTTYCTVCAIVRFGYSPKQDWLR